MHQTMGGLTSKNQELNPGFRCTSKEESKLILNAISINTY
jgi:hypothetical protein